MHFSLNDWRDMGEFAPLLGHDIFLIDTRETDRPVLLLLHGFPTSSLDFADLWQVLHKHFRLITLDFLGLGFSAKPFPHPYRIMEQATIAEAVLDYCAVSRCHILAHDYGDSVAQELLARDNIRSKHRYLSACLLNGGIFPESHRPTAMQKLVASWAGPWLIKVVSRQRLLDTFSSVFGPNTQPDEAMLDDVWTTVISDNGLRCLPPLLDYLRERCQHRERWVESLRDASCPLAMINGSADPVSGAHMVQRFREIVSGNHFIHELATIGHYPHIEAPEETLETYLTFARKLGAINK